MTGYRILSGVQAAAYCSMAASLAFKQPSPIGGQVTVFQLVGPAFVWMSFFAIGALWLATFCATRPQFLYTGHMFLIVVVAAYGMANLCTSITNSLGWTVFSLCAALAAGHGIAVRRRPLVGSATKG